MERECMCGEKAGENGYSEEREIEWRERVEREW